MSHVPGHIDPPPPCGSSAPGDPLSPLETQRELFFPATPLRLYPIDLGLAFGLTATLFMAFAIMLAKFSGRGSMSFFESLLPGFSLNGALGIVLGLLWCFIGGLVIGVLTGVLYNLRLRRYL